MQSKAEQMFYTKICMQVVEANKDARAKAAAEAEALLQQEQLAFEAWRDSLETVPTIKVNHHQDMKTSLHVLVCLSQAQ